MDAVNIVTILLNMHTSGYPIEEMVSMLEDVLVAEREHIRAEERERFAMIADDYGEGDIDGVSAAAFDEKYGLHSSLAAAIRGAPVEGGGE